MRRARLVGVCLCCCDCEVKKEKEGARGAPSFAMMMACLDVMVWMVCVVLREGGERDEFLWRL